MSETQEQGWEIDEAVIRKRIKAAMDARSEVWIHVAVFAVIHTVLFIIWRATSGGSGGIPWILLPLLGWGGGLLGHIIDTYLSPKVRYRLLEDRVNQELEALYGPYWYDTITQDDYNKVEKRVRKHMDKVKEFFTHLGVFVPINLLLWVIWWFAGTDGFPWPVIATVLWGMGLVGHAIEVFFSQYNDRRIEQEVQREMLRRRKAGKGKRKRLAGDDIDDDHVLRLSDDGELVEISPDA
ncbi:MAG: hypothetical protein D6712_10145 [Chloroflexi bacterium]|nr:MAG: hypothetical protein D6712_10145 [Chloroflexota bacterium]